MLFFFWEGAYDGTNKQKTNGQQKKGLMFAHSPLIVCSVCSI